MKKYCLIPETSRFKKGELIGPHLADLFKPYGGEPAGGVQGFGIASFRVKLPDRYLEFEFKMPDLSGWLFFEESPEELAEGYAELDEDYAPMRCLPPAVMDAYRRLLYYRADRLCSVIIERLAEATPESLEDLFPSVVLEFDGHCTLQPNHERPLPSVAESILDPDFPPF